VSEDEVLLFENESKLRRQMAQRGWTEQQVREALMAQPVPCTGRNGPALRYLHPQTGKSVVVDARTRRIFHVGGEGFLYD